MFFFAPTHGPGSAERDPYFKNVHLLIQSNQNNTTIRDNSLYRRSITKQGNIDTYFTTPKFGRGCINNAPNSLHNSATQFNPTTGTWFQVAANQIPAFGVDDFTIEMWVNQLDAAETDFSRNIFTTNDGINTTQAIVFFIASPDTLQFFVGATTLVGQMSMPAGWAHLAMTRQNGVVRAFVNGVKIGEIAHTTNYPTSLQYRFGSRHASLTSPTDFRTFRGRYDDVRVTVGIARYVDDFDVPTRQFSNMGTLDFFEVPTAAFPANSTDIAYSSVSLLLLGQGANGSTTFTDSSSTPKTVTRTGGTVISTAASKFGSSSIRFDGSGDGLSVPVNANSFGLTGKLYFTLETWVYVTANSTANAGGVRNATLCTYSYPSSGTVASAWSWILNGDASNTGTGMSLIFFNASGTQLTASVTFAAPLRKNTWHHVAVTRNSGALTIWVNGVPQKMTSNTIGLSSFASGLSSGLTIGASPYTLSEGYLNGYLEGFRITTDVVRYTT